MTVATTRAAFTSLGSVKPSTLRSKALSRDELIILVPEVLLSAAFAVDFNDNFCTVGAAPLQDSLLYSVPSDVIGQSFRDVEATLPGPQQQGLEPVAQYAIVPKQGGLSVVSSNDTFFCSTKPAAFCSALLFFPAGCWQQEYLQFQFGGAPVSQKALTRSPCGDPQYAALASGIIKVS